MIKFIKKNEIDILVIIIVILSFLYIGENFAVVKISGSSMANTYQDGDILIIKKTEKPEIGNLIVFTAPEWDSSGYKLIKRIVATEYDEIYIDNTNITVNNNIQEHRKICNIQNKKITLAKDEFLVAGDNKEYSNDSIYRLCSNKNSFKISEKDVFITGKEAFVFRRKL